MKRTLAALALSIAGPVFCAGPLVLVGAVAALAQVPTADVAREAKETQTAGCTTRAAAANAATVQPSQGVKGSLVAPSAAASIGDSRRDQRLGSAFRRRDDYHEFRPRNLCRLHRERHQSRRAHERRRRRGLRCHARSILRRNRGSGRRRVIWSCRRAANERPGAQRSRSGDRRDQRRPGRLEPKHQRSHRGRFGLGTGYTNRHGGAPTPKSHVAAADGQSERSSLCHDL